MDLFTQHDTTLPLMCTPLSLSTFHNLYQLSLMRLTEFSVDRTPSNIKNRKVARCSEDDG